MISKIANGYVQGKVDLTAKELERLEELRDQLQTLSREEQIYALGFVKGRCCANGLMEKEKHSLSAQS